MHLKYALISAVAVLAFGASAGLAQAAAPSGVSAVALDGKVDLAWQPAAGATEYTIYRGTTATTITTPLTPFGTLTGFPPPTSYTDATAQNGTTYYYAVRAVVGGVESANSLAVQARPVAGSCSVGNPVVVENCLPGTTPWGVRSAASVAAGGIEGFATAQSINKGQSVDLKVNSSASTTFNVEIYRTGYYGGAGARLFATMRNIPGTAQTGCTSDNATGLYECSNWSVSTSISTTANWPSGMYALRVVRNDNSNDNMILLAVRDDARHPDVMYGAGFTNFQAYNNYGGRSLYDFNSCCGNTVANATRAVKVSFDRPFNQTLDGQRDWYTKAEIATVYWLEQEGYDVAYASDADLELHPLLARNAKAYVSPAHDEYWSAGMRTGLTQARDAGVGVFFTGSNEVYWKIRFEPSPSGAPARTQVTYKSTQSGGADPSGIPTGTWRDPAGINQPENGISGAMYVGDRDFAGFPLVVSATQGADRIWRYTGLDAQVPGSSTSIGSSLVGWEWDARASNGAEPAGTKTLAGSPVTGNLIQNYGQYQTPGSTVSEMVKYKAASGATVVTTGTNWWNRGLAMNPSNEGEPDLRIQQATTNILADMGAQPATPAGNIVLDDGGANRPPAPTGVTATVTGTDSIRITWNPVAGAGGYNVYRTLTPRDGGLPLGARANGALVSGTTFTDTGLSSSTAYSYVVTTVTGGVQSAASAEVTSTTQASATEPTRINAGGPAVTSVTGASFRADTFATGGQTYSTSQSIAGTNDQALYQNERWGQFTYAIPVADGTYDVRLHFAELYYGTAVPACAGKRIFSMDVLNTTLSPDVSNLDICATAGPRTALVRTVSGVSVTNGTLSVRSVYGSQDDPEVTAIEVIPASGTPSPPTVTQTTPTSGATGVATSARPTATFSRAMDAATLTGSSFTLTPSGGSAVPATVSYDGPTSTATLTPASALASSTTYAAAVTTAAKAADGTPLEANVTWSFTTAAPPDTQGPVTSITAPAAGATLTGTTSVTASATDASGVAGVQFRLDGADLGAEDTSAPYSASWNTATATNGTHTLTAIARDTLNNTTTATSVSVTVDNPVDSQGPTVSITAPAGGATLTGTTSITANATDASGVAGVQFRLDGANLGAEDTSSPYSASWNTTTATNGTHTLTAIARDTLNNTSTATTVTVTVDNPPPDTQGPVVAITAPVGGATVSATTTLTATATDTSGVAAVQFRLDGANLGTEDTSSPYTTSWDTTTATNGTHTLTAIARDTLNNTTTSTTVTVTVSNVIAPPATRINAGGPAVTSVTGAVFSADTFATGGQTYSTTQSIAGTSDPALYQNERWGQFTYAIPVANGTYDVRLHFAELYYGTAVSGCAGKRIFSMDVLNTTLSPDVGNLDVCATAGPRTALVRTVSGVSVTNGTLSVRSVYGSQDDPEVTAIEVIPASGAPTVTQTTPTSGATGVATSARPTATFSRAMDAATLTGSSFTLTPSGGSAVPATVSYDGPTSTATLTPTSALASSTTYTAAVTTAAKAADGTPLAAPVTWSFTTAAPPDTQGPTVSITAPADGATLTGTTSVTANATDASGVAGVQFRLDGANLGAEDTSAPYSASWNTTTATNGTHTLTAIARDTLNNTSTATTVSVTVDNPPPDTQGPVTSITAPADGASVSGTTSVTANATDTSGVAGVQFRLDGANLGAEDTSAPYSASWNTATATNGTHTLTAIARDTLNNTTTATSVSVTVDNPVDSQGPTVSITAPAGGATLTGTTSVTANATDASGVAGVQFRLDGANLGTEDTSSPYAASWNTTTATNGTHTLTAIARDTLNNTSTATTVTVTVDNPPPDTQGPIVAITAPVGGATVSATTTLTATATDTSGVAAVQFRLDGANLGAEDTSSPYTTSWDTTAATNGTHTLTAIARDTLNNTTTSTTVTVTVSNVIAPPGVTLLGTTVVEPSMDSNPAGQAEAFKTTGIAAGALTSLRVYLHSTSASTKLVVGVYSDSANHPAALLTQATLNAPVAGAWNTVTVPSATIASGSSYWIAVLGPTGSGVLRIRDRGTTAGTAETSSQTNLTTLPATWTRAAIYTDGPLSAYGTS